MSGGQGINATIMTAKLLRQYSREFVMKIHPDRHQNHAEAQAANSKILGLITQLFQSDPPEMRPQLHQLCFYLKQSDAPMASSPAGNNGRIRSGFKVFKVGNDYLMAKYALFHQIPFTSRSIQSAAALFSAVGIKVDESALLIDASKPERTDKSCHANLLNSSISQFSTSFRLSQEEMADLRHFLQSHPNVILHPESARSAEVNSLLFLLQPTIQLLTQCASATIPLFIFSPRNAKPAYNVSEGVFHLPCDLSSFPGTLVGCCTELFY